MGWFSDPLPVGADAPDFTATDDRGNSVTLSRLRGHNIVLIFYPGDNTTVCRAQLCEFRDRWETAKGRDTLVFGVNPAGPASHAGFRDKNRLPFPLLVDAGKKIAAAYQCDSLIIRRTVYLIGKNGKILYRRRGKPPVDEVLAAAQS